MKTLLTSITHQTRFCAILQEFLFCGDRGASQNSQEALPFLDRLLSTQHFLQVSPTFQTLTAVPHIGPSPPLTPQCIHYPAPSCSTTVGFLKRVTFLPQEGFSCSEAFLYKFLNVWDGSLLRPQILGLLSNIPVVPSAREFSLVFVPTPPHPRLYVRFCRADRHNPASLSTFLVLARPALLYHTLGIELN